MEIGTDSCPPRAEGRRSDLSSTHFGSCQACAQQVVGLLDFGPQPLCNRFLRGVLTMRRHIRCAWGSVSAAGCSN